MATPIQMPSLSPTMKEGKITRWIKKFGVQVKSGEAIAEIETDKSNLELEAYDDGVLLLVAVNENESAPVGATIAFIGQKGEKVEAPPKGAPAAAPASEAKAPPPQQVRQMEQPQPKPSPEAPRQQPPPVTHGPPGSPMPRQAQGGGGQVLPFARPEGERVRASPLAKKMAQAQGLDLGSVQGSGPQGRIVKRDIEAAMAAGPRAAPAAKKAFVPAPIRGDRPEPTVIPITSMRKVIGQRMAEVKPGVPHFYLSVDIDMEAAMEIREEAKALDAKVSVNDIVVKAAAIALKRVPKVNVSWQGDRILQFETADVGIAVAIEDGLITPVIRDADLKGLQAISAESKDLAERARRRALKPDEYTGGSITISNLGMYGMDSFIAVINPPQAAIVAVGAASDKAVVRDGQVVVRKVMTATLSGDHRAIDGAIGAEYLRELKNLLEHPMRLLF
jgi:pyruvate dehydrogenase E2 component (dihydrolipoamide acetyltransferase)